MDQFSKFKKLTLVWVPELDVHVLGAQTFYFLPNAAWSDSREEDLQNKMSFQVLQDRLVFQYPKGLQS